jgi:putative DNA methylase
MLMPASDNPKKDREVFLKILTMDDDGVWLRCKPTAKRDFTREDFDALAYAERISYSERPENIDGPTEATWSDINAHLGTAASDLTELIEQLGWRAFGHTPRVGDSFCGGGSIPFEAARIGCEAYGSDLNPIAGLLTWASLSLLGGGKTVRDEARELQEASFAAADEQIARWGIEHNEQGERADAYLYCVEVKPEGCDYYIPLAPSWVISDKYRIVVTWKRVGSSDCLLPQVTSVSQDQFEHHKRQGGTVVDNRVLDPFNNDRSWSIDALRGPNGLRRWTNDDVVPRPDDSFQERLYCVRWINPDGNRRYASPDADDLSRETRALALLRERFARWQREGFIPSKPMPENGEKTDDVNGG